MKAEQAITMAAYNRWMNERLYAVCAELLMKNASRIAGLFSGPSTAH